MMNNKLIIVLMLLGVTACSNAPMRESSYDSSSYNSNKPDSNRVGPDILEGSDTGTPSVTPGASSGNSGPPTGSHSR